MKFGCRVLVGLVWALVGCTDLPNIESDVCGNAVLEDGEDCDTVVEHAGARCRPPGVENECQFDCTTASDGSRAACPNGMGCATDGVCRDPTGSFDPKQPLAPDTSAWLSVANFDGDERPEIISTEPVDELGLARFRLHYFDNDAQLVETRTFPRFTSRPIARDVTGDGFDDLLISNGQIGVVPGRRDREWVPIAFSSYVLEKSSLRGVGVRKEGVYDGVAIVTLATVEGVSGIYVVDNEAGALALRAELPRAADQLAGDLLAADLFPGSQSPCAEVVVAFRGDTRLRVFDLCAPAADLKMTDVDWRALEDVGQQVIELPDDLQIEAGPMTGDVDGDGHLDIVFGVARAPHVVPYVVYGDGTRMLPDAVPLELNLLSLEQAEPVMPLAMGDVSGDGIADYVLPQQVLVSIQAFDGSGVGHRRASDNRGTPWTMAQIADLNANGFPDIVSAAAGESGFTFHNGTGGRFVVGVRVATARPPRFFTIGDFDGDLVQDLGILEQGAASEGKDTLSIAFGVAGGLPLPAARISEVAGVDQLGDCSVGGMDTPFLVTTRPTGQTTFTLFDGSPDRLPIAPYALVTFTVDSSIQDNIAAGLVFGAFSRPGAKDLVAVGTDLESSEFTQWLLPDLGGLVEPPRQLQMASPEGISPVRAHGTQKALRLAGAAADLDADGRDEALWLMPGIESGCGLLIYDVDADAGKAIERQVVRFESACLSPALAVGDMNRDGAPEVLVSLGNVAADDPSRLEVLWNDGRGAVSVAEAARVGPERGHELRAFALLGARGVVFVTDTGLYKADLDGRSFGEVETLSRLEGGRSVVLTDPNADGLPDIVAADAAGLWLLRAQLK